MNRTFWLFILALCVAGQANAQLYAGGSLGYGQTGVEDVNRYRSATFHIDQSTKSTAYAAFVGYRFKWLAIEGGMMKLPEYFARMDTTDYTAYLGKDIGIKTAYAEDTVRANATYVRGNLYLSRGAWQPYVTAGIARVTSDQYTYGLYDGKTLGIANYHTAKNAGIYGFGVQYGRGNIFGRVEALRVPLATENPATGRRDVWMVMGSVGYTF
jgi:hypothetical protein